MKIPVGTWCLNEFLSTFKLHYDVTSTSVRRHFVCPLGRTFYDNTDQCIAVLARMLSGNALRSGL